MSEPAYVRIAGEYARRIRSGEIPAGSPLLSYADLAGQHSVSEIVIRKAVELLQSQGLVRVVSRKGVFVADQPLLVRVSPERQLESPEDTYSNESESDVEVERSRNNVPATTELAEVFDVSVGTEIVHVMTMASASGRPVSISDTYHPVDVVDVSQAVFLEETVADRLPTLSHAQWLNAAPGGLVKHVHQRFVDSDGRVIMVSDVSYPRDRYDAFKFRMAINRGYSE